MATKQPTGIQVTDMSTKWGLVTVFDTAGNIVREYPITAKQALAVSNGNNVVPPGCTPADWFAGRVSVEHRPCNPGQSVINPDGTMVVNFGVAFAAGRKNISLMHLQSSEYAQIGGILHVDALIAPQIDQPFAAVAPEQIKVL